MTYAYHEVFVPGGFPSHTYNPRVRLNLEARLREAKENLCKLVTVVGQTKSGKTVLARSVLPRNDCVWVDGGHVSQESDFWETVLHQLDLFQTIEQESTSATSATVSGKAQAGASLVFVKGSGEVGGELEKTRGAIERSSRKTSSHVAALSGLNEAQVPLVIDDFHYIPRDLQGGIVRALKQPIFDGLPVAIIAIPHRRYDAIRVEKEMTGRISVIEIPSWSEDELEYIPNSGFPLLDIKMDEEVVNRLGAEAIGSPHLMQEFCRAICRFWDTRGEKSGGDLPPEAVEGIFRQVAESIGRPIFDKLARGPRQRTDRISREMKDGQTVDIYQLILYALAYIKPGLVSLEYEDLRTAIREVSASQTPAIHEVARVLRHMATIAANEQSSAPVIDFEEDEKKLHITDPFFALYLRWGDLRQ